MNRPEYLQTNYQKDIISLKGNTNEQFLQILVPADMTTTNRGGLQQKHSNSIHSWSNQFWNPNANFSVKMDYERTSNSNLTHRWKNDFAFSDATVLTKNNEQKEKCIKRPSFKCERLRTRSKFCMHLQKFRCLPASARQRHNSVTRMPTKEQEHFLTSMTTFKKQLQW